MAHFHSPKNFSALQWECTHWVGNPKMFHCLCLKKGQCSLGSYQFLLECWGRCFLLGWGEKRYCFYLHQSELQRAGVPVQVVCVLKRSRVDHARIWLQWTKSQLPSGTFLKLPFVIYCHHLFLSHAWWLFIFIRMSAHLTSVQNWGFLPLILMVPCFGSVPGIHSYVLYSSLSFTSLYDWMGFFSAER